MEKPKTMAEAMRQIGAFFELVILEIAYTLKLDIVVDWLARILRRFTK